MLRREPIWVVEKSHPKRPGPVERRIGTGEGCQEEGGGHAQPCGAEAHQAIPCARFRAERKLCRAHSGCFYDRVIGYRLPVPSHRGSPGLTTHYLSLHERLCLPLTSTPNKQWNLSPTQHSLPAKPTWILSTVCLKSRIYNHIPC